jgi:hypothetical protein
MPLVRSIARDALKGGGRFSALVLGVVKSKPFQMNTKTVDEADPNKVGRAVPAASKEDKKGAN